MSAFAGNRAGPPGLGIAVVCLAQFVVVLDATIVATALPAIRTALGFSAADLQWVITGYALVFGGFLIAGGRIADLAGPRRVFLLGLGLFVAASIGCALAWSPTALIGSRLVQGLGSALLSPAALALLTALTDAGQARRRAIGWWTAAAATGGASGWVLGGLLTQYLGWPFVFWVNLPIGLGAMAVAPRLLPAGVRARGATLDLVGALTATTALGLLVYGLAGAGERGLLAVRSWTPIAIAAVLLMALARRERRLRDPLVPPAFLRSRPIVAANLTALALTATTTPAMFLAILYVQLVLRFSPARASLLFPIFNLAVIGGSLSAPRVLRRIGARRTLVIGFVGIGAGVTVLVALSPAIAVMQLLAAFTLMGTGLGIASVASTHTGTEAAEPARQGVASGLLNSAAQIGTAFGLAIVTPLATSGGSPSMDGFRVGFLAAGTIVTLGILVSFLALPLGHDGVDSVAAEDGVRDHCGRTGDAGTITEHGRRDDQVGRGERLTTT
jgi:MFS family permease